MRFFRKFFNKPPLSPRCSVCSRIAADIELYEDSGTWYLKYSGPGGSSGSALEIEHESAQKIQDAFIQPYKYEKIKLADFYDDAGYCIECGKFYCPNHWNISSTGGGRCPNGHFKSLDPHY